ALRNKELAKENQVLENRIEQLKTVMVQQGEEYGDDLIQTNSQLEQAHSAVRNLGRAVLGMKEQREILTEENAALQLRISQLEQQQPFPSFLFRPVKAASSTDTSPSPTTGSTSTSPETYSPSDAGRRLSVFSKFSEHDSSPETAVRGGLNPNAKPFKFNQG
ncbi:MAG: hypothetical protein K0U12_03600, partial [Gammaproteobacteria bacterium]|nr:hypothetical protein [Gammaproteobacteria bacterium]